MHKAKGKAWITSMKAALVHACKGHKGKMLQMALLNWNNPQGLVANVTNRFIKHPIASDAIFLQSILEFKTQHDAAMHNMHSLAA